MESLIGACSLVLEFWTGSGEREGVGRGGRHWPTAGAKPWPGRQSNPKTADQQRSSCSCLV